jgi:glycosyltransferase involved in cell wall biosynthesis
MTESVSVSINIPCLNEERAIRTLVLSLIRDVPNVTINVFDNASSDKTSEEARAAGANVYYVEAKGKGNVIREIQKSVDSDLIVIVDGDGTYPSFEVANLINVMLTDREGMLVGTRLDKAEEKAISPLHKFGNITISSLFSSAFSENLSDVLSGLRVITNDCFNAMFLRSNGFDIEVEMGAQCLLKGYPITEKPIVFEARKDGSESKLKTFRDGIKIVRKIVRLMRDYRPLQFYSLISLALLLAAIGAGYITLVDYFSTGTVIHVPRAILATGLGILSSFALFLGIVLRTLQLHRLEIIQSIKNVKARKSRK